MLASTDPDRAVRPVSDAERIANLITGEYEKAFALSRVAEALASTDPGRAARLLTDAEHIANSITDKYWRATVLSDVVRALAATNPDRAERIAYFIDEYSKAFALSEVAEALAATDPARAAKLLTDAEDTANSVTGNTRKALVLSRVARALAAIDPDRAERVAHSITDEYPRASALSGIARAWLRYPVPPRHAVVDLAGMPLVRWLSRTLDLPDDPPAPGL